MRSLILLIVVLSGCALGQQGVQPNQHAAQELDRQKPDSASEDRPRTRASPQAESDVNIAQSRREEPHPDSATPNSDGSLTGRAERLADFESHTPPANDNDLVMQTAWADDIRPEAGAPNDGSPSDPSLTPPPLELDRSPAKPDTCLNKPLPQASWACTEWQHVKSDHRNFYTWERMFSLGSGVSLAAALANSTADDQIRTYYRTTLVPRDDRGLRDVFHQPGFIGDGWITLPTLAGTAIVGHYFPEGTFGRGMGNWGDRSLRAMLVGAPPMLALQQITGADRPEMSVHGSSWQPFQSGHGVSGHAFIGAVPFLTAADMVDQPLWKAVFYAGSVLPGLSRINDDKHYASQVILGWWIAYLATSAVNDTHNQDSHWSVEPVAMGDGLGAAIEYRR